MVLLAAALLSAADPVAAHADSCQRCTAYRTANPSAWLCSSTSSCAKDKDADPGKCPKEYKDNHSCWLRENWAKVTKLQGIRADRLVIGAGDRAVSFNLPALECACSAWQVGADANETQATTCTYKVSPPLL